MSITAERKAEVIKTNANKVGDTGSPDGLILVRANPDIAQLTANSREQIVGTGTAAEATLLTSRRVTGVQGSDKQVFVLHSCSQADIFQGQYTSGTGSDIYLDVTQAPNDPMSGLLNAELRIDFAQGASITNLKPRAYFVATSTNATNAASLVFSGGNLGIGTATMTQTLTVNDSGTTTFGGAVGGTVATSAAMADHVLWDASC